MRLIKEWQHRRLRRKHQKYAQTMGVFWKECPNCGEYFGGHEWELDGVEVRSLVFSYGEEKAYVGVCPVCCRAGIGITMEEALGEMFEEPVEPVFEISLSDDELLG